MNSEPIYIQLLECSYAAYDKGDNDCRYELLILRAKHELCYFDDDEPIEISYYDDIMNHTRCSHMGCNGFK